MAKTTQYQIQLKEEVTAQLRNIEGKLSTTNAKMAEMGKTQANAFDAAKMTAYGAAAVMALGKIADFVGDAVKAYGDFEEKSLRLTAQLKVSGNQLGLTASQVLNLASALEDATGIDDSALLDAVATMQTFQNVTGKTFEEAIKQSANMSVVFGDVDTAAKALGKALDDPTNGLAALSKAGVRFNDAEKEQIELLQSSGNLLGAQTIILDKIKGKFDGLAESINVGVNGSIRGLGNAWDDFMKFFGSGISNVMAPQIRALTGLLKGLTPPTSTGTTSTRPGSLRDAFSAGREADAVKGALEFEAEMAKAEAARVALAAARATLLASATTKIPEFLSPYKNPNEGTPVSTGYYAPNGPYVSDWTSAMGTDGGAGSQAGKIISAFKPGALLGADPKQKTWAEKFKEDLDKALPTINAIGTAWSEVSKTFSLYAKLQEDATQANLDRMGRELDEYTAAQDLKIEIARRNGEDTGQMEVDKANEVYLRKKQIADAERDAKKKAWEANRQSSITEAAMAGLVAGLDALKQPFPFNFILAGLIAGTTAANVGMIASQQMPTFAQGGIVPGSSFVGDQVLARVNSGEMVLNRPQQARLLAIANGGGGGTTIIIDKVYGNVDQEFIASLNRAQDLRDYRGIA